MAIALDQHTVSTVATTPNLNQTTPLATVTAGELVVLLIANGNSTGTTPTVSAISNGGALANVTFAKAVGLHDATNLNNVEIWSGVVQASDVNVSFNVTFTTKVQGSGSGLAAAAVATFTGAAGTLDLTASAGPTSSVTGTVPSITPTHANSLFVGSLLAGVTYTSGPTNGYTEIGPGIAHGMGMGLFIATDALAHNTTYSAATATPFDAVAATFAPLGPSTEFVASVV